MTAIAGKIEDSGGIGLDGILRVTLDAALIDTGDTPDAIQLPAPVEFAIADGAVSLTLTQSETANITYRFEFLQQQTINSYYFADGDLYTGPKHFYTDNNWYTGSAHTEDSVLLYEFSETRSETLLDFHAIVPNTATVEFASLMPTGITTDILDTSIRRLAEILTGNVDYVEALRGGPRFLGEYSPATYYKQDDSVSYGGASWIWIAADPGVGSTPAIANPNWQLIAEKGEPGGTDGQDTAYDATGWNGALWAPTANVVRDKLESMAPLDSPELIGTPTAPLQLLTDESDAIATTLWVTQKVEDAFANAAFDTPANTEDSTAPATTEFVKNVINRYSRLSDQKSSGTAGGSAVVGEQVRDLNTIEANAGDIVALAANTFTLRPGTYSIAAIAPAFAVDSHRLSLWDATTPSRLATGVNTRAIAAAFAGSVACLSAQITLSANTDLQIRHFCQSAYADFGLGVSIGEVGIPEIYTVVEIRRLD